LLDQKRIFINRLSFPYKLKNKQRTDAKGLADQPKVGLLKNHRRAKTERLKTKQIIKEKSG